jgi:hypothetical protein
MFAYVLKALTSRAAGPLASALCLLLAVLLLVTWTVSRRTQAELGAQISSLTRQMEELGGYWQTRATSCEAGRPPVTVAGGQALEGASPTPVAHTGAGASPEDMAARLASEAPAGFDVCARMESADRAVLGTLK